VTEDVQVEVVEPVTSAAVEGDAFPDINAQPAAAVG